MDAPTLPIYYPLSVTTEITSFLVYNYLAAIVLTLLCIVVYVSNKNEIYRPSYSLGVLVLILYVWPLALFSNQLEMSITGYWRYALSLHSIVFAMILLGRIYKKINLNKTPEFFLTIDNPDLSSFQTYFPLVLGVMLIFLYLHGVPLQCTAMHSLLFDPIYTLLAREFSMKVVGATYSTYAFGALANTVVPVIVAVVYINVAFYVKRRKIFLVSLWAIVGVLSLFSLLVIGAKGLLIPTIIMLLVCSMLWGKTFLYKLISAGLVVLFLIAFIVGFEVVKERAGESNISYDYAMCARSINKCEESKELARSLLKRDLSLSIPLGLSRKLNERVDCVCSQSDDSLHECPVISKDYVNKITGKYTEHVVLEDPSEKSPYQELYTASVSKQAEQAVQEQAEQEQAEQEQAEQEQSEQTKQFTKVERFGQYLHPIFQRIFVIPFQVSTWHYLIIDLEGSPGIGGTVFGRRLQSSNINMPELVYQHIGSVYAGGDKTSTSTAPTSFIFMYPSYLGASGVMLVLFLIVLFDVVVLYIISGSDKKVMPIVLGVVLGINYNMLSSEFTTVMFSHGALIGIMLIYAIVKHQTILNVITKLRYKF